MFDNDTMQATVIFLNHLESGEELRAVHVMRRIHYLLTERLSDGGEENLTAATPPTPSAGEDATPPADNSEWRDTFEEPQEEWSSTDGETARKQFEDAVRELEATDKPLFVDVQFLTTSTGDCVIKEFSAECAGFPVAWVTVKSPSDAIPNTRDNEYCTRNVHGLTWDAGIIDLDELRSITSGLFRAGRRVYMKGMAKVTTIAKKLQVRRSDITEMGNLRNLRLLRCHIDRAERCPYHKHKSSDLACAKIHTRALLREGCID